MKALVSSIGSRAVRDGPRNGPRICRSFLAVVLLERPEDKYKMSIHVMMVSNEMTGYY